MSTPSNKITAGADRIYRVVKTLVVWAAVAFGAYLLFPIISTYISRPEVITIVVGLNALATITLWREATRRPPRPKKEFIESLLHGDPITPKHNPPKIAGGKFASHADDEYRHFFADFAAFADVVNWYLARHHSHWRLQERPDGDASLNVDFSYGPMLGRCYDIFHNQVELGRLEIRPSHMIPEAPNLTTELITTIELHRVRLLRFDSIAEFLGAVARHVCDRDAVGARYTNASQAIIAALTKALWQTQQISEFGDLDGQDWGELSLHLYGLAPTWYFDQREALRNYT